MKSFQIKFILAMVIGIFVLPKSGQSENSSEFVPIAYAVKTPIKFPRNSTSYPEKMNSLVRTAFGIGDHGDSGLVECSISRADVQPGEQFTIQTTNGGSAIVMKRIYSEGNRTLSLQLYRVPVVNGAPNFNAANEDSLLVSANCIQSLDTASGVVKYSLGESSALHYLPLLLDLKEFQLASSH